MSLVTCRYAIVLALTSVLGTPATAFDYVVTRYDDPVPDGCLADDCSLREAVLAANVDTALDRVLLSAGTYLLERPGAAENNGVIGDLDLRADVELIGAGAAMTTIDGNQLDSVLHFGPVGVGFEFDALVRGVTITGAGGGVTPYGVFVQSNARVTIEHCEIRGDGTDGSGDGVHATVGGEVTLRSSVVAGNGDQGVSISQASALLENTTLSGNETDQIVVSGSEGTPGAVTCRHCTLVEAGGTGSALRAAADSTLTLENTLIVGDCQVVGGGVLDSAGGNFESPDATCQLDGADDVDDSPSGILPLADNGGPTRTAAVPFFSIVPDNSHDGNCLPTDQRGVSRPQNGNLVPGARCDAGAFELSAALPPTPIFHDGFLQGDAEAWSATTE